jgi:hypothetical protein
VLLTARLYQPVNRVNKIFRRPVDIQATPLYGNVATDFVNLAARCNGIVEVAFDVETSVAESVTFAARHEWPRRFELRKPSRQRGRCPIATMNFLSRPSGRVSC